MFNPTMSKLMRKFLVLAMLVACLAVLTTTNFNPNKVSAAVCCSTCDANYDSCTSGCEPGFLGCFRLCERIYNRCLSTCDPNC